MIQMPRAFNIKNTQENGHIDYGKEVQFSPALKVSDYHPYMYSADKNGENKNSLGIKDLKKQIDKEEE